MAGQSPSTPATRSRPGGQKTSDLAVPKLCAAAWTEWVRKPVLMPALFLFLFLHVHMCVERARVCAHVCSCTSTWMPGCTEVGLGMGSLHRLFSISFTETRLNNGLGSSDCLASQLVLESRLCRLSALCPLSYLLKPPHQTPRYLEPSQICSWVYCKQPLLKSCGDYCPQTRCKAGNTLLPHRCYTATLTTGQEEGPQEVMSSQTLKKTTAGARGQRRRAEQGTRRAGDGGEGRAGNAQGRRTES